MAQPNVAREPSMEEILASIRRIIESNDPEGAKGFSATPPIYDGEDDEDHGPVRLTIEEDIAEESFYAVTEEIVPQMTSPIARQAEEAAAAVAPEPQAPKNISLADLAARVRAAANTPEPPMPQALAPAPSKSVVFESPVPAAGLAELRAAQPAAALREPEMAPEPAAVAQRPIVTAPAAAAIERAPAPVTVEAPAADHPPAVIPEPANTQTPGAAAQQALVSLETGAHVARSFDELAAAIDGERKRSLDEMAEEMLRPMLKDWLDDNLPTLVERLVREEIERVARGPRR